MNEEYYLFLLFKIIESECLKKGVGCQWIEWQQPFIDVKENYLKRKEIMKKDLLIENKNLSDPLYWELLVNNCATDFTLKYLKSYDLDHNFLMN